jgi:hypothetical protein
VASSAHPGPRLVTAELVHNVPCRCRGRRDACLLSSAMALYTCKKIGSSLCTPRCCTRPGQEFGASRLSQLRMPRACASSLLGLWRSDSAILPELRRPFHVPWLMLHSCAYAAAICFACGCVSFRNTCNCHSYFCAMVPSLFRCFSQAVWFYFGTL